MFRSRCKAARRHGVTLWVAGLAALAFASQLRAAGNSFDSNLAEFTASVDKPKVAPGSVVKLTIKCTPKPGYHTYPIEKQFTDEALGLSFGKSEWLHPLWKHLQTEPMPTLIFLPGGKTTNGFESEFTASIYVWVSDKTPAAKQKLEVEIEGPVCDMTSCVLLRDAKLTVDLDVAGKPVAPPSKFDDDIKSLGSTQPNKKPDTEPDTADKKQVRALIDARTAEDYSKSMQEILDALVDSGPATAPAKKGLAFLYAGFFWGFVSLLTPCVFPMIPITVSFFLKQSERSHHRPITMAAVYCSTIVIVMTIAAVALLSFFQWLSQNAFTNLAIGVLFVVFALSLFGMYELELPSFIAQWTASKESKGGFVGTIFTALTFTILSFACVAPFLGGFGGAAASEQFTFLERFLGGLVFAVTFASPFFILALFPSLLRKMPKSGTWLNSVKVVMGFLELAAAFKFLRLGEMLLSSNGVSFFTYDFVLGLWIALAILCALYLLNFYRLPNDTPLECLGVPRVLLAGVFFCLAFYMLPALFKYNAEGAQQRPNGSVYAWIDSFLLPDKSVSTELVWSGDLKKMIAEARRDGERADKTPRVLIDVTGKSCTNCRINEQDVFPRPEITSLLQKYKLVELYTDIVPAEFYSVPVDLERVKADGRTNYDFEDKAFKNVELPLYAIVAVEPDNKLRIVDTYGGRITNVEEFATFLRDNAGAK